MSVAAYQPPNIDWPPKRACRPRIGFDSAPSQSGPGRYVQAIVQGLSREEWDVVFLPDSFASETGADFPAERSAQHSSKLRSYALRAVPRPLKIWAGFGRETLTYSRRIQGERLDIVHLQRTGCEQAPVAARVAKVPRVLGTFHVSPSLDLAQIRSGPTHRALEWVSSQSLHRGIAVCEAVRRDWSQRTGLPNDRIITIHNGIDPDKFQRRRSRAAARHELGLPLDAIILGGVGRLEQVKGFSHLIAALSLLLGEFPPVFVAIAGAGPLQEQLSEQIRTAGLEQRVALLGFQSDVGLVLDACDVFVLSSLSEAMPFALLEAMAHALPCVGTSVGGVPEAIVSGQCGFLCAPNDAKGLATAISPLLASAQLRERFGEAARTRVMRHFQEADMVQKTIAVYRQLVEKQHHTTR
jgi:glycosyltransferase involved in cell wall biosynthesis